MTPLQNSVLFSLYTASISLASNTAGETMPIFSVEAQYNESVGEIIFIDSFTFFFVNLLR